MIICKNTELRCVVVFHRQGTLENVIYLINIITTEKIIKQQHQTQKLIEQDI